MRGWRWVRWAVNMPTDSERLCAWLTRRYRLTGSQTVTTCEALRSSPMRRVSHLDKVLRELAAEGVLVVLRCGRARWIEFDPVAVASGAAAAKELFPDLYREGARGGDPWAVYARALDAAQRTISAPPSQPTSLHGNP